MNGFATAEESFVNKAESVCTLQKIHGSFDSFVAEVERAAGRIQALQFNQSLALGSIDASDVMEQTTLENPFDIDRLDSQIIIASNDGAVLNTSAAHAEVTGPCAEVHTNNAIATGLNNGTAHKMSTSEYKMLISSLNREQQQSFLEVVRWNAQMHEYHMGRLSNPPAQLMLFISGGAGTGKSYLIRAIEEHFRQVHPNKLPILAAPTGVAAFNIAGMTLHNALGLPVDRTPTGSASNLPPLPDDKLRSMRERWRNVHTLIIDEISMVSSRILSYILTRLSVIKDVRTQGVWFGNLNIICLGDFYQLRPIKSQHVFAGSTTATQGQQTSTPIHLWKSLFRYVELTQNVRQKGDDVWISILNRIRIGRPTTADIKILKTRLSKSLGGTVDLNEPPFKTAIRLMATRSLSDDFNQQCVDSLTTTKYTINCIHTIIGQRGRAPGLVSYNDIPNRLIPDDDDLCGGLKKQLVLAVGTRVMLRNNIFVQDGLVNGATGVIVGLQWNYGGCQQTPGELPSGALVCFDDARVGVLTRSTGINVQLQQQFGVGTIAIEPYQVRFMCHEGTLVQRSQLPLISCFAATIHKCQGITLKTAVLDLGPSIFAEAQAYVAQSRISSLDGLALIQLSVKTLMNYVKDADSEYERLRSLQSMHVSVVNEVRTPDADATRTETERSGTFSETIDLCTMSLSSEQSGENDFVMGDHELEQDSVSITSQNSETISNLAKPSVISRAGRHCKANPRYM
jgi:hypothetical protein